MNDRPLKLAIAAGIFHPEAGGPATYLYHVLPELQARGWNVRLITYSDNTPSTLYPYPVTRIPRRTLPVRMAHYAWAARSLLRWADAVYTHALDLPLIDRRAPRVVKIVGDPAWERAVRKGWIAPTEDIDEFQTRAYSRVVALARVSRARQVQAMDAVIVPSEYLKRMVLGWGVDAAKIHVIYNALPPQSGAASISQTEARERLGLGREPILLTGGRLTAWKGVDHLIAALKRVPDVRLIVAGDGPMLVQLQAQAAALHGRVVFVGRVPNEQMALYMKAADYFVLYSGYEGLSHVLLESLQAGTPVIASDKGGNPEVVQHGMNGLLVPYVNVEALVAALQDAFRPGVRETLAANTRAGKERFAFARMVEQTDEVLRNSAESKEVPSTD